MNKAVFPINVKVFQFSHLRDVQSLLSICLPYYKPKKILDLYTFKLSWILNRILNFLEKRTISSLFSSNYDNISFVAENEKRQVVGFVLVKHWGDDVWSIQNLAVHPTHRRGSIGSRLFETTLSYVKERRGKRILLSVDINNVAALNFYKRYGFTTYPSMTFMQLKIDN